LREEIFNSEANVLDESIIGKIVSDIFQQSEKITREDGFIIIYTFIINYFSLSEPKNVLSFKDNNSFTKELGKNAASFLFNNNILYGTTISSLKWQNPHDSKMLPQVVMTKEEAIVICLRLLRQTPVFRIAEHEKIGWGFNFSEALSHDEIEDLLLNNWDIFNDCIQISRNNINQIERHPDGRIHIIINNGTNIRAFINGYGYAFLLNFMFKYNIIDIFTNNDEVFFGLSSITGSNYMNVYYLSFSDIKSNGKGTAIIIPENIMKKYNGFWYSSVTHYDLDNLQLAEENIKKCVLPTMSQ
jgi:hypothetical protein